MAVVTMRQLLEAGVHFGHQTRKWNPKMRRFIYGERNGIYVIDIRQTVGYIERAYSYTRDLVARGGTVMFIGTKKQAGEVIEYQANRVGMPYVTERWMGGMLTNFQTMKGRISRLKELEAMEASGTHELLPEVAVEPAVAASVAVAGTGGRESRGDTAYGDGERLGPLPVSLRVLPASLDVLF